MSKYSYYCDILGVDNNASIKEIKIIYKKLAIEYHPDKHINSNDIYFYELKMKEINEAYSYLINNYNDRKYERKEYERKEYERKEYERKEYERKEYERKEYERKEYKHKEKLNNIFSIKGLIIFLFAIFLFLFAILF